MRARVCLFVCERACEGFDFFVFMYFGEGGPGHGCHVLNEVFGGSWWWWLVTILVFSCLLTL